MLPVIPEICVFRRLLFLPGTEGANLSHFWRAYNLCRNISGHTLMGCPDAILETMVLVIHLYVLVYIVQAKDYDFPCMGAIS